MTRRRTLLPSKLQKNRTLVILIVIAAAAIILVVAALALATFYGPGDGGVGGGGPYQPSVRSGRNTDLRVDSVSIDQNLTGSTTFNITVTNTGDDRVTGNLSVQVYQGTTPPAPNQPYPNQDPGLGQPDPGSARAVTSSQQFIELEAGETRSVPVVLSTPPGYTIDPANVVVTLS